MSHCIVRRPLAEALRLAEDLADELAPYCDRIEVAGSIRRRVPLIGDLELVAIPRFGDAMMQTNLFGAPRQLGEAENALKSYIDAEMVATGRVEPLKPNTRAHVPDPTWSRKGTARYWRLFLPRESMQLDFFLPDVDTWGVIYMQRTGSPDFARAVVMRWAQVSGGGRSWKGRLHPPVRAGEAPYCVDDQGKPLGPPLDTPTERSVFEAVGLRWVAPTARKDEHALRRAA